MRRALLILILFSSPLLNFAMTPGGMYDFRAALVEYQDSLAAGKDSLFYTEAAKKAENGIALSEFCHKPKVVARRRFHASEFFLFFPLPAKSWHSTQYEGVYVNVPGEVPDTLVRPVSDSLERFSIVCGDRKYFSSERLYGVGGYDLYVSGRKRTGKWSEPENLGFPYSSPYDDFLFMNTEDGRYSVFASSRECPQDSVNVYVVEFETVPVKSRVREPLELRTLCALEPAVSAGPSLAGNGAEKVPQDENTRKYVEKINLVRRLRDSLSLNAKKLDALRENYLSAPSDKKREAAAGITSAESEGVGLRSRMEAESKALHEIEMDFLMKGVTIDIDKLITESDETVKVSDTGFRFTKREPGKPVVIRYVR